MRTLVVEDDTVLRDVMVRSLRDAGHRVDEACNLVDAEHFWRVQAFDAVLLDLNVPTAPGADAPMGSGLTVLRAARARGDSTPVLVLTARDRTEERIAGLDAGADDYLGKPFDLSEVEARLRALVRRSQGTLDPVLRIGTLSFDRSSRTVYLEGSMIDLRRRELAVLETLMGRPGKVVAKDRLSAEVFNFDDAVTPNALVLPPDAKALCPPAPITML